MKKAAIGIAVGGVIIAGFILLRPRPAGPPTATLPDGTQIIVQAVTYGTNHVFVHGSKLLNTVHRFVPGFMNRWLPPMYAMTMTTSEEFLIVWHSAFNPATGKYVAPQVDRFSVIDEHGCTFQVMQYGGTQSTPTFSVSGVYVSVFPRRQKIFTFRAKFVNYPAVDLQVPNPLFPVTTEWTPEPLPVTQKTNNLAVTLTKLRLNDARSSAAADFDIYEDGAYRNDWYSPARNFRDATGNSSDNPLCLYEHAWKLEVDLYKTAKAPFAESNIWRVPNVIIPKSGEMKMLTNETQMTRLSLKPIALCGAGDFVFSNEVCLSSAPWKGRLE